ncbi:MAG: YkgJ family cysteine cluster protein [Candidatus Norongarragalinales archaeon]
MRAKQLPKNALACKRCGECCSAPFSIVWSVDGRDIARWKKQGRKYVLSRLKKLAPGMLVFFGEPNPEFRGRKTCPFLAKKNGRPTCLIHETKPGVCKAFICEKRLRAFRKSLR